MRNITYILSGALLVLAVGGYLLPEKSEPLPNRILMNGAAGRVVFNHEAHAAREGVECIACHHDAKKNDQAGQSCNTCHGLEFDDSFRGHSYTLAPETCSVCHHVTMTTKRWGHSRHARTPGIECTSCHHGPQIEPVPQDCASCHDAREDMGPILSLKNAVHARCASCHEEALGNDMTTCVLCHDLTPSREQERNGRPPEQALVSCESCHEAEPSRLVPATMSAYHGLCIGCHEKQGGPVDDCAQCHTK